MVIRDHHPIERRDNPGIGGRLTKARYRKASHVAIASGTGQVLLEGALEQARIERNVVLRLPGFLGLTGVVGASDLFVTLPRHIGETLAELAGLDVHKCPSPVARFTVKQHWHERFQKDPANRWLRIRGGEVFSGVTAVPIPGHTPGHTAYRISDGSDSLFIWGDTVHVPEIQVRRPEVTLDFDSDPDASAAMRRRIFDMAVSERLLIAGMHVHFPGFAHVVRRGDGYELVPEAWQVSL
jgi:hypothetical protein